MTVRRNKPRKQKPALKLRREVLAPLVDTALADVRGGLTTTGTTAPPGPPIGGHPASARLCNLGGANHNRRALAL